MAWTKRDFITQAFEEAGLGSYVFDLTPEQLQVALRKLNAMMATWNAKGIRLGYPLPSSPNGDDLDDVVSVPDRAHEAMILSLAVRLAPGFGKAMSPDTKVAAREAYNAMMAHYTQPIEMAYSGTLPVGAGNKPMNIDRPFFDQPVSPLTVGPDSPIDFE
jgi:hypothetical protein